MADDEYAQVTKTRVGVSGKAEKVTMSSIPIFEVEQLGSPAPLEENADDVVDVADIVIPAAVPAKRRKKANDSVSTPCYRLFSIAETLQTKTNSFLRIQTTVLDEIVSLDGPGDHPLDICSSCSDRQSSPLYRCIECSYSSLYCGGCVIEQHKKLPLHRLEVRLSSRCMQSLDSHQTSIGQMDSSTGPPSTQSGSYVTLDTTVTVVPSGLNPSTSPSST